ncbi:MAG: DUF6230 family protein [Gordonia sp. (in: high G+C Gram-positive bacteria)]
MKRFGRKSADGGKATKVKKVRTTRPKIFVGCLVGGLAIFAAMGVGMARGDVPIQMSVSGEDFEASLSKLNGSDVAVYPRSIATVNNGRVETVVVTMGSATLDDLCLAMSAPKIPILGTVTMVIHAPGASTHAKNMVMDVDGLGADMTLQHVVVGASEPARDAESSKLATAIAAPNAAILNVDANVIALRAEQLSVSNAKVSVTRGESSCE